EGNICIDVNKEINEQNLLNVDERLNLASESELAKEPQVSLNFENKQPFVLYNHKLYLQRYFHYETMILKSIISFINEEKDLSDKRSKYLLENKNFIKKLFKRNSTSIDWQLIAALSAVLNKFTVITGGPGTGKTTTVSKILALLFNENLDLEVALAAPTGKAAARMAASLNDPKFDVDEKVKTMFKSLEPSTIHRLLKYQRNSTLFKHNKGNPLPYDVVIVDESSMIDISLFAKLLDAVGPQTRLILLGDKDQLASVEAGSLFGDICQAIEKLNEFSLSKANFFNQFLIEDSDIINDNENILKPSSQFLNHPLFEHIIELTFSHRFSKSEGIGQFSIAVINNDIEVISKFIKSPISPQVEIDTSNDEKIFSNFIDGYISFIEEPDILKALTKLNEIRVLCAVRSGEKGLYSLNNKIETYLLNKKVIVKTGDFYNNRPIIITSNFYKLGLFNGDIGLLRYDDNGVLKAWFNDAGKLKSIIPGYISSAETVFAMTTHKSQGSEFEKVMIVLPDYYSSILTRELLYTAVTRAKKKVIIQSSSEILFKTTEAKVKRGSGLIERFIESDIKI
ncbi:MAG: exodeoxyribonuclease V subunit alpha, partial [Ferruginibacter sp.]